MDTSLQLLCVKVCINLSYTPFLQVLLVPNTSRIYGPSNSYITPNSLHTCYHNSVAEDTVESPETPLAQGPVAAEIAQGGGEAPACEAEAANIVSNVFTFLNL